jgi:hypothetical protein
VPEPPPTRGGRAILADPATYFRRAARTGSSLSRSSPYLARSDTTASFVCGADFVLFPDLDRVAEGDAISRRISERGRCGPGFFLRNLPGSGQLECAAGGGEGLGSPARPPLFSHLKGAGDTHGNRRFS